MQIIYNSLRGILKYIMVVGVIVCSMKNHIIVEKSSWLRYFIKGNWENNNKKILELGWVIK